MAKTYHVELKRDDAGWWVATVPRVPGAHTQGRSIDQALHRIRHVLQLWGHAAGESALVPRIHLPSTARRDVERASAARERAEKAGQEAAVAVQDAVAELSDREGLSVRDIAILLELSPARVGQLKASHTAGKESAARSGGMAAAKRRR